MKSRIFLAALTLFLAGAMTLDGQATTAPSPQTPESISRRERVSIMRRAQLQLLQAKASQKAVTQELEALRQKLRNETGLEDFTGINPSKLIGDLQQQREQIRLEQAGADGRRAGIEEAIKRISAQLKEAVESDQALVELGKVVDLRPKDFTRDQQLNKAGAVPQRDVDEAELGLATATANLAEARQRRGSIATDALANWNHELISLEVADAERRAKLEFIARRMKDLESAKPDVDAYYHALSQLNDADRGVRDAEKAVTRLEGEERP